MKKKARVLIIDDQPTWLDIFTELLQELNLEVVSTNNYDDAILLIDQEYFHLVISDVRLVDEDKDNKQGLDILSYIDKVGLNDVITKVVITGYGTRDWARQSFKEHQVHDFIPKQGPDGKGFDENDFIQSIKTALAQKISINFDLIIEYVNGLSLDDMVYKVEKSCGNVQVEMLRWELDDLLRKLFPDANQIIVSPVSGGHSRSGVVKVEPFYKERGQAAALIVKYGKVNEIEQEAKNFQDIKRFTTGQRYTNLERKARTRLLGGIVYSLMEKVRSFNDLYQVSDSNIVCSIFDDLFTRSCRKWYENRQPKHTSNLLELYWIPAHNKYEELMACFKSMYPRYVDKPRISFPGLDRDFINPIYHHFVKDKPVYLPIHTAITHGDLHGENLLVDRDNLTWLIDFYRTGEGHIFRDFIALETTVKFQLLAEEEMSILYEFEKAIQAPREFTERLERSNLPISEEINKAFDAIDCLRRHAGRVVQPSEEMQDYYAGLFYQTMNLIRYYSLLQFKQRKYYILLSAAMLCEKLINWQEW